MLSTEMQSYVNNEKLYREKAAKVYNYNIDEFEICDSKWRHKSWETWCKGSDRYNETKKIVENSNQTSFINGFTNLIRHILNNIY